MSQTPNSENRTQRRAREREERKAAKRLASFNSDSQPSSSQSVPTLSSNNKKKNKKSTGGSFKKTNGLATPQDEKPAYNSVVGPSPCPLIMVESGAAPSVAVDVAFSQHKQINKPVTATSQETAPMTKSVDQTAVPNGVQDDQAASALKKEDATAAAVTTAATTTAAATAATPSSVNEPVAQKEVKEEKGSVVDPVVNGGQAESGPNADQQHSATTVEDKQQLQTTPASEKEKGSSPKPTPSESNQTNNTLVGKEDSEKQPLSPQKEANSSPVSNSPPPSEEKKSTKLLDKFKEKSKTGAKNEPKKESKKKVWQFWKK
ncbi:hypothetical protein INT43_000995 [Umbelopsis isabellina]|uniref:Uncharacterized protein n=1 Tax=Mortierella isabellina TaxID=91625 RepID=A0A8H7Q2T6_MORIS|nr:hypothetical protein INT43_000995 [Umbelopsis isabellina]